MSIRSGKGDKGYTDLSFKKGVSKDALELEAIGDLDELSSYLGLIKSKVKSRSEKGMLEKIQHALSIIATEISVGVDKRKRMGNLIKDEDTDWINKAVHLLEQKAKLKSSFYLPGEGEVSAFFDIARSVARRAERSAVTLYRKEKIKNEAILVYLNCVSDLLFVVARKKAHSERKVKVRKTKKR